MKRTAESEVNGRIGKGILKKRTKTVLSEEEVRKSFLKGLFSKEILEGYRKAYTESKPYKHSVINSLIDDTLLRSVRAEIRDNVHFTPKETDIYKIHQSGDLANLDGLDDGALEKLPSLLRLRDVLYSASFREYISTITASGALSGRKTDMAINVYTPGCHLLCHDDVIGSRRVSYILYLTDPDIPWKKEWGGALRLYPTQTFIEEDGGTTKTPSPDFSKIIPPAWNQLSFFAVQPGESFHDVEEVYHTASKEELEKDGGRIRMAISGWYHIPQVGEEGYVKGAEEKWGANSSLMQLQGHRDRYDFPKSTPKSIDVDEVGDDKQEGFETEDLDFLLKYMTPTYLTPDTLEQIAERFEEESSVTLDGLLAPKFAQKLKAYIEAQEAIPIPSSAAEIEDEGPWKVAKPPHKHRFLYQHPSSPSDTLSPLHELADVFMSSKQFRQWLEIATGCRIEDYDVLPRRFRKGLDYALATGHDGKARLEIGLGLTPTTGWVVEADEDDQEEEEAKEAIPAQTNGKRKRQEYDAEDSDAASPPRKQIKVQPNGHAPAPSKSANTNGTNGHSTPQPPPSKEEPPDHGGHEDYMAIDSSADADSDGDDAAIYKTTRQDSEDDNVLFTMPASWNKLSIVLRDSGVLRFVKYVSKGAPGDRWDVVGGFGVREEDEDEDEEEEDREREGLGEGQQRGEVNGTKVDLEDSEEEVWNGFEDSGDSESD